MAAAYHNIKKVCQMAKKSKRELIKLVSSASPHFYCTVKNKSKTPEKIEIKKYDPVVRKHVLYKEGTPKKGRKFAAVD